MSNIDEEIKVELKELFNKANEGIESTSGFMKSQLPDVIEQLLLWKAVHSSLVFLLGVGFLLVSVIWWRFTKHQQAQYNINEDEHGMWRAFKTLGSGFLFVVGFFVTALNLTWLQIMVAPKFYLMEYTLKMF